VVNYGILKLILWFFNLNKLEVNYGILKLILKSLKIYKDS
jgi:hypothetical protein